MTFDVIHNPALNRFEIDLGDGMAVLDYEEEGSVLRLVSTEVPVQHRNQGVAAALVKGALAEIRAMGKKVVPVCPYVVVYFKRYPAERDVMVSGEE